jgi:hypothetical protein
VARPVLTSQAANAASERNWSAADDLSGGDPAAVSADMLNARLALKKNTPVRALIDGVSLFDALTMKYGCVTRFSFQATFKPFYRLILDKPTCKS